MTEDTTPERIPDQPSRDDTVEVPEHKDPVTLSFAINEQAQLPAVQQSIEALPSSATESISDTEALADPEEPGTQETQLAPSRFLAKFQRRQLLLLVFLCLLIICAFAYWLSQQGQQDKLKRPEPGENILVYVTKDYARAHNFTIAPLVPSALIQAIPTRRHYPFRRRPIDDLVPIEYLADVLRNNELIGRDYQNLVGLLGKPHMESGKFLNPMLIHAYNYRGRGRKLLDLSGMDMTSGKIVGYTVFPLAEGNSWLILDCTGGKVRRYRFLYPGFESLYIGKERYIGDGLTDEEHPIMPFMDPQDWITIPVHSTADVW